MPDLAPDELVPAPPEHCGPGALLGVLLQAGGHLRLQEDDHLVQAEDDRGPGGGLATGLEQGPQVLTGWRGSTDSAMQVI